jgi:osmotically-inducible protein OsmY
MQNGFWISGVMVALAGIAVMPVGTGCRFLSQSNSSVPESQVSPTVVASSATLGSKVTAALANEPKLKGSNIVVSVSNLDGTVVLSGTVAQRSQEKRVIEIAKKQAKGAKVVSQIKMQPLEPVGKS